MKTLDDWFNEYAQSHQHPVNKTIHYICVPAIYFSIVGLLVSIPTDFLKGIVKLNAPIVENWAFIGLFIIVLFYVRLSFLMALKMLLFSILCLLANYYIGLVTNLFFFSISVFAIAWLGQFYGHKLEGKKPSFIKDLQFLLIGPAWVMQKIFSSK